ncbi:MAG: TauD/TfdA family dioxygenase [Rhodospirillaceae bacterium]|jgi:taurine dioxygenase
MAVNDPSTITAKRLTKHIAAEISGADLSKPLSDKVFAKIRELFLEHAVLVFHDQKMNNEQLMDFSQRFGRLDVHHLIEHTLPEHPEIRILTNKKKKDGQYMGAYNAGHNWHTDQSFKEKPMLGTLLLCDECPPEGGNTEFASLTAAYDALSDEAKQKIEHMIATHDRNYSYNKRYPERPPLSDDQLKQVPPVTHPMVRIHRETGRKGLYISLSCIRDIEGMTREEARALVEQLNEHATQPEYVYSHHWKVGDLVVWDNRCLLHRATPFDESHIRFMRRTQIKEDGPFSADAA